MPEARHYEFDGLTIDIPIHFDRRAGIYIEDYPDFMAAPVWTGSGHRVLFSGSDACAEAEGRQPGQCLDCAACKFFTHAAEHTWFGCCTNKNSPVNLTPKKEAK